MALGTFEFTKNWTNPQDFPTEAQNEEQARENIQFQPDEIRDYLNRQVVPEVNRKNAAEIPDDKLSGISYRLGASAGGIYIEEVK